MLGSLAPSFEMEATDGLGSGRRRVALVDYRGRWLMLVFYPRDFSLVCPTELTGLSRNLAHFQEQGCEILGVSCDSIESHEKWLTTPRDQGGIPGLRFPLASDPGGEVSKAYGVYLEYQKVPLRAVFILDPNGVIQYQVVHNLSVGRKAEELIRVIAALQTGGLCSEDWTRESETIDPTKVLVAGSVASHYRIEEMIGSGSFSHVYRARDLLLDRQVALKVFKPKAASNVSTVLAEARTVAALNHPNICTVFAVDDSLGVPAIAMEYVPGRSLSRTLSGEALDHSRVASIGRQIAEGMAVAHAQGVIHGDLKPENVMVSEGDSVKILDFGLSRRNETAKDPDATWTLGSDLAGLSGTPCYLAPERTWGEPATIESDIFALGLILYEMLNGRKAFEGRDVLDVLGRIRRIDADALAGQTPEPFTSLIRQCLLPDPHERLSEMKSIATHLGAFLSPLLSR